MFYLFFKDALHQWKWQKRLLNQAHKNIHPQNNVKFILDLSVFKYELANLSSQWITKRCPNCQYLLYFKHLRKIKFPFKFFFFVSPVDCCLTLFISSLHLREIGLSKVALERGRKLISVTQNNFFRQPCRLLPDLLNSLREGTPFHLLKVRL